MSSMTLNELITRLEDEAAGLSSITHKDRHAQLMRDAASRFRVFRSGYQLRELVDPSPFNKDEPDTED